MIIFSVPIPDLIESVEDEEKTFELILVAMKKLESDGTDFIVIACNSLQYMNDRWQKEVNIPIVGIAPSVSEFIKHKGYKSVGILSTGTTIKKKVYDQFLKEIGARLVLPNEEDQKEIERIILNEIGGKTTADDTENLRRVVDRLQKDGAEAVMLACTELPLLLTQKGVNVPFVDCNEIYALNAGELSSKKL